MAVPSGRQVSRSALGLQPVDTVEQPMAAPLPRPVRTGMSRQPPLLEGDFYEGAFGPSILLVLTSREAVAWLRSIFDGLARASIGAVLRLDSQTGVEIGAALTALELRRVEHPPDRHLVQAPDGSFTWSCTADEWQTVSLMLEPLLKQSGHQYLTSESLLENLPTVGGTDLELPGQDAACR
jgi:hypothetical protein